MQSNQVVIIGEVVGWIPELTVINNSPRTEITLRVNRGGDSALNRTDDVSVVFWGRQAELIDKHVKEGMLIMVTGQLRIESWVDQHKNNRQTVYVLASTFEFLGARKEKANV